MKLYREKRKGDKNMMPDLVMGWGQEIIRDESKKEKSKESSFINELTLFIKISMLKKELKKLDYRDTVSKNAEVMNGIEVFKGTRIPVKVVYEYFIEKSKKGNFDPKNFICDIKEEYPSLKNKKDKTIIKGLMYCVGHKSTFTLFK